MFACSLLSLLMLGVAGTMIDTHRRDWRRAWGGGVPEGSAREADKWRFALSRHRRRMAASVLLAAAGVLIAVWPVTPRTPFWVMNYTAALSLVAVALLGCGVYDAIASTRYYRKLSRDLFQRQRRELAELMEPGDETSGPADDASEARR